MNKLAIIDEISSDLDQLQFGDEKARDAIIRKTEMIIRRIFGEKSKYLNDLEKIRFHPGFAPATNDARIKAWKMGHSQLANLLWTMKEEIILFEGAGDVKDSETGIPDSQVPQSERVFIVHGHDATMKESVARTLSKLELHPIILHEQAGHGRTIIEKFENYANVGFAVVLLSPDDICYCKSEGPEKKKQRARQNVILELGYFLGKLGRNRVVALHRETDDFEMPTDYSGVSFVPFDESGRWQFDLVKELRAADYSVDANKLV